MKPMDRKGLEALVDKAWSRLVCAEYNEHATEHETSLRKAITDAIWGAMVPARESGAPDEFVVNDRHAKGFRALICTDDPVVLEPDALKLARMVRGLWPLSVRVATGEVIAILAEADRIIEEAPDGD